MIEKQEKQLGQQTLEPFVIRLIRAIEQLPVTSQENRKQVQHIHIDGSWHQVATEKSYGRVSKSRELQGGLRTTYCLETPDEDLIEIKVTDNLISRSTTDRKPKSAYITVDGQTNTKDTLNKAIHAVAEFFDAKDPTIRRLKQDFNKIKPK